MNWTKHQYDAIFHTNGSAIVSAAAGSGKTAVLVERVLQIISNEENPVPANTLVVVTFTNKAADELRFRLNKAVKNLLRTKNSAFLKKQLLLLQEAKISTISSFCINILRSNLEKLPLSAGFSVLDEEQKEIISEKAMEIAVEKFYNEYNDDEALQIFNYFVAKDDSPLVQAVLKLHNFMANIPDKAEWIEKQKERYAVENASESYQLYANVMLEEIASIMQKAQNLALQNYEEANASANSKLIDCANGDKMQVDNIISAINKQDNHAISIQLGEKLSRFPTLKDYDTTRLKARREALKKLLGKASELIFSESDFEADIKVQKKIIDGLFALLSLYEIEFAQMKQARNAIDFSDAEQMCLQLLRENGQPSSVAKELSDEISMIIVDEFQDSNDLQYEIFRMLSRQEQNLFFVGDIKQSIYGFRGSNPNVFGNICKNTNYRQLPLNQNFRSRESVVDIVNTVFNATMTEKVGGTDYQAANLVFGASYDGNNPLAELVIVDEEDGVEDGSYVEVQAKYVASKINDMIKTGFTVTGKNGEQRPLAMSDICVLMRSPGASAKYFVNSLRDFGITANATNIKDYLALHEITLILDFLTVIDNPLRDVELLSTLMSPLFMFSAEEIAAIKISMAGMDFEEIEKYIDISKVYAKYQKKSLYACLLDCGKAFDEDMIDSLFESDVDKCNMLKLMSEKPELFRRTGDEKCQYFLDTLAKLRLFMASNSTERLIRKIYDSTDFFALISLYEYSNQKVANLRKLLDYADKFEKNGGTSLSDFLRYINRIREQKRDLEQANVSSDSDGSVQIMSIHGSKGLEFPVVFLCDTQKQFNKMDLYEGLLCDVEYGVGLKMADKDLMIKYDTLPYKAIQRLNENKLRSEEMRLLYVALTRAKEKLIITAGCEGGLSAFVDEAKAGDLGEVNSHFDWLKESVYPHLNEKVQAKLKDEKRAVLADIPLIISSGEYGEAAVQEKEIAVVEPDSVISEQIIANLSHIYRNQKLTTIPAKFTATQLTKNTAEAAEKEIGLYLRKPSFFQSQATGKDRGDAYHKVMELLDFKAYSENNIEFTISLWYNEQKLSKDEFDLINTDDIAKFFRTELGQRAISSDKIFKEYPIFTLYEGFDDLPADSLPIVQGIADMFFLEDGEIVLVDYKTDRVQDVQKLADLYAKQLLIYKNALEKTLGMRVKECYIYSFHKGMAISIS